MKRKYIMYIGVLAVLGTLAVVWNPKKVEPEIQVSNFEECVKAGYPVMESYPRQCSTPSGKFFVEEIIPER
jgi:hypothetical protein